MIIVNRICNFLCLKESLSVNNQEWIIHYKVIPLCFIFKLWLIMLILQHGHLTSLLWPLCTVLSYHCPLCHCLHLSLSVPVYIYLNQLVIYAESFSLSFSLSPDSHLAMCYSSCVCVSLMWPFFVLYWSHSPNDLLQNLLLLFTGPDLFLHFCCALVHVLSFHKCVE